MEFSEFYLKKKQELQDTDSWRDLKSAQGLDFCSNDYLGFAQNLDLKKRIIDKLKDYPLGSGGSRLLRGQSRLTEQLEEQLARFSGTEASLYFASGYQANLGLHSTLFRSDSVVFSDERVHASIIDGIRLSSCEKYIWQHNDLADLEMLLRQKARSDKMNFVVVESIYSMLGDLAPLKEIVDLCQTYQAHLIVDEAHATGLYGERGSGLVEAAGLTKKVFATLHTGGKALGVSGAWVGSSQDLKNWLINRSRPFIYSTAPAYFQQVALMEAIYFVSEKSKEWQQQFRRQHERLYQILKEYEDDQTQISGLGSPILAVIVGTNRRALSFMMQMQELEIDVRAIRPPSVPEGEALLRVTCPLSRTAEDLEKLKAAWRVAWRKL